MAELSVAQRLALLDPVAREAAMAGIDPEDMLHDFSVWARPSQLPPEGNWVTWLLQAGRGAGKTRAAAEWMNDRVRTGKAKRMALLARTAADVRDVMIQGDSGLIACARPDEVPIWEPSKRRVSWPNGAFALCIAEGQPVLTSRGWLPIEQMVPGVRVRTRGGYWNVRTAGLTDINREVVEVVTESATLRCTPDHRILRGTMMNSRRDDWIPAGDLKLGDMVHVLDVSAGPSAKSVMQPVVMVAPAGRARVYDLTVEGHPEFWAGGILVHNCFSADEPDQLRGPQFDSGWADEFASYPQITGVDGLTAFDNLRLGLRLPVPGDMPRMVATTTPRRVPSMFKLLEEAENPEFGIVVTHSTTYDNLANLAPAFRATILGLYEGTRIGRQELLGEMLHDIEGALFMQSHLDDARVTELPINIRMHTVVGVDPSVAERPKDEAGIVVVRGTAERDFYKRQLYIVEDATVLGSPAVWAKRVVDMAIKWSAPVVAEGNQGGELVRMAIGQVNSNVPVYIVHAKAGKATRAEPVAALAEQGRLHMWNYLPLLESEITSWVPSESRYSPGRLDAMVWAALALTTKVKGATFATSTELRAKSLAHHRLPQLTAANLSKRTLYQGRRR